jgi:hypothetical protein
LSVGPHHEGSGMGQVSTTRKRADGTLRLYDTFIAILTGSLCFGLYFNVYNSKCRVRDRRLKDYKHNLRKCDKLLSATSIVYIRVRYFVKRGQSGETPVIVSPVFTALAYKARDAYTMYFIGLQNKLRTKIHQYHCCLNFMYIRWYVTRINRHVNI